MIKLEDMVGTMVFSSSGNYIVGASERENAEFQKKCQNKININLQDCVELSCVKEFVLTSENYNDIMKVKGMPGSIFGDKFGYEMQKEIAGYMESYYAGETGKEDIENYFYECCSSMRVYLSQTRRTTGIDEKDNAQIISQIYEMFAKENQRKANYANYQEGLKVNSEYGGDKQAADWSYYNSDYYYQCEETHQFLKDITQKMTEKWCVPPIDTEDVEKKSKLILDGNFDFNSGWNHHFRRQHSRSSIKDESLAPPEKFKIYYRENNNNSGLGVLAIWAGENKKEIDVPFQIIPDSLKGQIYNVSDLVEFSKNETTHWEKYNAFCKNFDIFTRLYAYASSINMQTGNYEPNYE
jgi:hypothetical protein